jgi:hypothetical protein
MFLSEKSGKEVADAHGRADLVIGNNVFAHVPDVVDFARGLRALVAEDGVVSLEFPHLLRLIEGRQYDTIYHEHYSYFSLLTVTRALERHGLAIFDVEELPTHGGSLRIYAGHEPREPGERVVELRERERAAGLEELATYLAFADRVRSEKREIVRFFIEQKEAGVSIAGYGAPAKGNTLLNYCGVGPELIRFTVDRSPHKQGFALPGTRIPIFAPEHVFEAKPDYLLVLPWNLRDEIIEDMGAIRDWGGRFVFPIPEVSVVD